VDPAAVETNMVFLDLKPFGITAPELSAALREREILTLGFPGHGMRLVTHRDVEATDIETALDAFTGCLLR
jgi:threonine aldolase